MEDLSKLRNFGIIAHIDAGKTTLTERILYRTGRRHRMGNVDDGDTVTDWQPEERERGITITAAAVTSFWRGFQLNLVDTPGHVDFAAEVERSLRVLDGAVVVFCGVAGVQAQSESVWRIADRYGVPRICFINKLDRAGADFRKVLSHMQTRLSIPPVAVQIPDGLSAEFSGVVDLVRMRRLTFNWERETPECQDEEIPARILGEALEARIELIGKAAECSDELLELFANNKEVPEDLLCAALRKGTLERKLCPVLCGSALNNRGIEPALDALVNFLPSPLDRPPVQGIHPRHQQRVEQPAHKDGPLAALVFKTDTSEHGTLAFVRIYSGKIHAGLRAYNPGRKAAERIHKLWRIFADKQEELEEAAAGDIVGVVGLKGTVTGDTLCEGAHPILLESIQFPQTVVSVSVEPCTSADQGSLEAALKLMVLDDPTLEVKMDEETGQTILSGMGELHLEIIRDRLLRLHRLNVRVGQPRVRYRESISAAATAKGTFDREIGGKQHWAVVEVQLIPTETLDFVVDSELDPKSSPKKLVDPMLEAIRLAGGSGPVEGYPLLRLQATIKSVDFDPALSTETALAGAAAEAFEVAVLQAKPIILEPIMALELTVPIEHVGDILFDLTGRRAEIQQTEIILEGQRIRALCPLAELFGYASQFRSLTRGRGELTIEPRDYQPRRAR